ncbi:hypothetical protein AVEN_221711-1 [Araneus ventricosus]|uniref:Uncharacterized protein n=1 Tax=Araneus ventricosus TaxID=182803 RepID=A0A4Y2UV58_ARAVE|nr:hypothetical protein AVEN_221711-1 [Araneus ventricosus]
MYLVILSRGQMSRKSPTSGIPSPNFRNIPVRGRLATRNDSACSRPYTRRIFRAIGLRTCNSPAKSRDLSTRPPRSRFNRLT